MVSWCRGCGTLYSHDHDADDVCSAECRTELHRRLLGKPGQETRKRPAPTPRRTLSIHEGFTDLANQTLGPAETAQRNDALAADMVARLALSGGRETRGKRAATPSDLAPLERRDAQPTGFTRAEQKSFEAWLKFLGA
jgi:hypothetical protein